MLLATARLSHKKPSLSATADVGVRRMKKTLIYTSIIIAITGVIFIGFIASMIDSPYEYTQKYGNKETKTLYTAYEMAENKTSMKRIRKYLHENNIKFIVEHKEENLVTLHADTKGHGETVLIWYENGIATGARFDDFL